MIMDFFGDMSKEQILLVVSVVCVVAIWVSLKIENWRERKSLEELEKDFRELTKGMTK